VYPLCCYYVTALWTHSLRNEHTSSKRTTERGVFYEVRFVSNAGYRVEGKQTISSLQNFLLAYVLYFENIKLGLYHLHPVCVSVLVYPLSTFECINQFGTNIMAPEPISTACIVNTFHQSVCLYMYSPVSLLGNGSMPLDTFSMRSVSYQRRVYGFICVSP
jgi:hypothetical protein